MKSLRFFMMIGAIVCAFFLSFLAYLYWQIDESELEIEGPYRDTFPSLDFDEIVRRIPGSIPILQYHIVMTPHNSERLEPVIRRHPRLRRFVVTSEEFRNHLDVLYKRGFRPISLDEYLSLSSGVVTSLKRLSPNTKPFVITFDDATYGQFDMVDTNADGIPEIDPFCAVGILLDFHREHPDFALNAAFCIDFSNVPFLQPSHVKDKMNILLDYGFEIVNHTWRHRSLRQVLRRSSEEFVAEIGQAMEKFESYLGYRARSINKVAYPNGHVSSQVKDAVKEITYRGKTYRFVAALHAFGLQAPHPQSMRFDPYAIPRIEMSERNFEKFVLLAPYLMKMPQLLERAQKDQ